MANPDPEPHPENLTPFQPGQSGNPAGHSRGRRLTTRLLAIMDKQGIDGPFLNVGLKAALEGDFKFWSYIFDRVDGKPTSRTDEAMVRIARKRADADTAAGTLAELTEEAERRALEYERRRREGTPDGTPGPQP